MHQKKLASIIVSISIVLVLLLRFLLGIFRYFDPDEFGHLHWAFHFFLGLKPYKDFFIYHIPFFQFFLLPIFILPHVPQTVILARVVMFGVFVGSTVSVFCITYYFTKNRLTSLLSAFIVAIFPIMADKSIEIRPDTLMVFLFLLAVIPLLKKEQLSLRMSFLSGLMLGTSIMMFQKIIFAVPSILFLFFFEPIKQVLIKREKTIWEYKDTIVAFGVGVLVPATIFIFYLAANGILKTGYEAIVPITHAIYALDIMKFSPLLALTPWPLIYVDRGGPSLPWALNTFLLATLVGGLLLLMVEKKWKMFFFYVLFFGMSLFYLMFFPTPFVQYFLPIAIVGSTLSAVFFSTILSLFKYKIAVVGTLLICGVGIFSYFEQYRVRVSAGNTNAEQMQVLRDVVAHIKPNETVYDMTGSYVFRPPGFILCCHRYANFIYLIKPPPPTLTQSLLKNETKFVILDRNGYLFWLVPEPDITFLRTNYIESKYYKIYSLGYRFLCDKGTCTRLNLDKQPIYTTPYNILPVAISETYNVTTEPPGGMVTFADFQMTDGESHKFDKGEYRFVVPTSVTNVKIQLDR